MSSLVRLSITLLFSTLIFVVFAIFAFTGLFPWIEAQFYSPRVVTSLQNRLESQDSGLLEWQTSVDKKIQALAESKSLNGVFDPTQSRSNIQQRYQATKLFLQGFHNGAILRVTDSSLSELHFSTSDEDLLRQGALSLTYKRVTDLSDAPVLLALQKDLAVGKNQLLWDDKGQSFVFVWPWRDPESEISGLILLTLSLGDAQNYLFQKGLLGFHESFLMAGWGLPLFFDSGPKDLSLEERVQTLSSRGVWPPVQKLAQSSEGQTWMLITAHPKSDSIFGKPAVLVLQNRLELNLGLKVIILISFYTVCFLLIFLILNGKGDPVSNVSQKVKRFQIQVLKQYLDQKEKEKTLELRKTLARHSEQIKLDILKSLGKVRPKDETWVKDYISRSWAEILALLGANEENLPGDSQQKTAEFDWNKLETVLERVISRVGYKLQPVSKESLKTQPKQDSSSTINLQTKKTVSEDAEELEEIEELQDAENVEDLEEVEELEELEEFEEAEEVEELESVEELKEAEELEELEEAEELEEVSDSENSERVQKLEQTEELEELEKVKEPSEELSFIPARASGSSDSQSYAPSGSFLPGNDTLRLHQNEVLEELEADSSGLADLEELPRQDGSLELLGRVEGHDGPSFPSKSPLAEVLESDEEAEELEELLSLDDSDAPEDESKKNGSPEKVFFSMEDLDRAWGTGDAQVFEESGDLVRLSDQVFQTVPSPGDDFGRLVEGVLRRGSSVAVEEEFIPQRELWPWVWTGGGFDLEKFIGPLKSERSRLFRGLNELTSEFGAFSCALLEATTGEWVATASVGFSDQGKTLLHYGPESFLAKACLETRGLHLLDGTPGHNRLIWESFHAKDVRYLGAVALLPALMNSQLAWVLLGYKTYPQNILELLKPRVLQ
jgi:hypothetical protein